MLGVALPAFRFPTERLLAMRPSAAPPVPEFKNLSRRVFRFDAAVSLLSALTVMAGLLLVLVGAAFLSDRVWRPPPAPLQVEVALREGDGLEEGMAGDNPELGEGNTVSPDTLSAGEENLAYDQTGTPSVFSQVIDAAGQQGADFDAPVLQRGAGGGGSGGLPGGTGLRGKGEGGGGTLPRALRWSIVYGGNQSLENYAQMLDAFGIELGVVRGDRVTYVTGLSKGKPVVNRSRSGEDRLFFIWKDAARKEADLQLLRKAGVATDSAVVAHFYPPALENRLALLEREFKQRDPKEITQTRFGVRRGSSGYEFYVLSQSYSQSTGES